MSNISRIFISYRRADSHLIAGRMAQFLDGIPDIKDVFLDIDGIAPGDDFVDKIHNTLEKAECCLVLIGPDWYGGEDENGKPRLFSEHDFVRLECQLALESKIRVIPILLDNTPIPDVSDLPEGLKKLNRLNAFNLRTLHFDEDLDTLLDVLFGLKQGRGSRWHRKKLTWLSIVKRIVGGGSAAVVVIFLLAVINSLVFSDDCGLECRLGFSVKKFICVAIFIGALLPFLPRLLSRK